MKKKNQIGYLLSALLLAGCNGPQEPKKDTESTAFCIDEQFRSKIELQRPKKQLVTEGIQLTGVVEPNPDKVVHLVSLVGGIVSQANFSLGDKVAKGQVLAELRSSDLSDLHSQSKAIVSQLRVAEKRFQAAQSMYNDGVSSQRELLEAQSELDVLKAENEKINANLGLYSASTERGVFQIKSPTTGIITSKSISAGQQIAAEGEPLFTVSDLGQVWVMANIYATHITSIETGMEVDIKTLSYPNEIFKGKITAISQVLDSETRVLKARIILENTNLKLKPGMIVDVTALKDLKAEALGVPTSAMIFDNDQNFLVVYQGDCEMTVRNVQILSKSNGTTFLSEGLKEDEQIVSKNHLLIYEQLKNFQN